VLCVRQNRTGAELDCGEDEYGIWADYFSLDVDYGAIKSALSHNDPIMAEAVKHGAGIRLLRQDKWETLVSFIISQNNRIPMIQKTLEHMAEAFGGLSHAEMAAATVERLRECRMGFRAEYIHGAIAAQLDLDGISSLPTDELRQRLVSLKGVGRKVSDCVLMFAFGRYEVFPVDVWVRRAMERLYFGGKEVPLKEIFAFAEEKFGDLSAYANQYLFNYMRNVRR
jgi:N-glycosylase/DNA lyase